MTGLLRFWMTARGRVTVVTVMWLLMPTTVAIRLTGGPWWPLGTVCTLVALIAITYGVTDYRRDRLEDRETQRRLDREQAARVVRQLPPDLTACAYCGKPHS